MVYCDEQVAGFGGNSTRLIFVCDGVFSRETDPLVVKTSVASVVFSKPPTSLPFLSSVGVKPLTVVQVLDRLGCVYTTVKLRVSYRRAGKVFSRCVCRGLPR